MNSRISSHTRIVFFFKLMFFVSLPAAKAQTDLLLDWAKKLESQVHPTEGGVEGTSIKTDSSGNIYVTGNFSGTADFDPGEGVVNLISGGQSDIFYAKYDTNGNYIFAKRIGSRGSDLSTSILVDKLGSAYVTGKFSGTVDFDPSEGVANL